MRTDGQTWRLAYAINLTRPRETSSTAAFTPTGDALKTKEEILAAVSARIKLNRPLPVTCDRELVEQRQHRQFEDWYEATRRGGWYLSTPQVAPILGGFNIYMSNQYWDNPDEGDCDEDLHLGGVLVPAEPQYAQELFQRVEAEKHPSDRDLLALLNYPGKEAERILEKTIETGTTSGLTASRVLYYLRYRLAPQHPLDEKLIGRWNIRGRSERVELEFHEDHTCVINTRLTEVTRDSPFYRPVDGRGFWAIRDGKLWIGRNEIQEDGKWRLARREFFPPKKMLKIERDSITLEGGPPMKRRPQESERP